MDLLFLSFGNLCCCAFLVLLLAAAVSYMNLLFLCTPAPEVRYITIVKDVFTSVFTARLLFAFMLAHHVRDVFFQ